MQNGGFPFPEGTIEFHVRTDWSSRWLPERSIKPFWTLLPFSLGYRHNIDRDDRGLFLTWLQFHPAGAKGPGWLARAGAYAAFNAGEWAHIACTWTQEPPCYEVFLNGKRAARLSERPPTAQDDGTLSLGPLDGTYDELRLSRVVRYTDSFTPPATPLAADRDTVLLFHFDGDLRSSGQGPSVEFAGP